MTSLKNNLLFAFLLLLLSTSIAQQSNNVTIKTLQTKCKIEEKYLLSFEKGIDTFYEKGLHFYPVIRIPNLNFLNDTLFVFANKKLIYCGADSSLTFITLKLNSKRKNTLSVFRVRAKRMIKVNLDSQFNIIQLYVVEDEDYKRDIWYILFKSSINPYPH